MIGLVKFNVIDSGPLHPRIPFVDIRDINEHESTSENGAVIDESVKWRPKLCYKYAEQK